MAEATKRCPFCAEEILVAAIKCKHCGSEVPNRKTLATELSPQDIRGLIFLALAILGGVIVAWLITRDNKPASASAAAPSAASAVEKQELSASVHIVGGALLSIQNNDNADWTECRATLNPHGVFVSGGFDTPIGVIPIHEQKLIPLAIFTDEDGKRFDARESVVKLVLVTCQTRDGFRTFAGSQVP